MLKLLVWMDVLLRDRGQHCDLSWRMDVFDNPLFVGLQFEAE